ncbi:hypothetical protein BS47DRAFT_1366225 [Hydnum rufescens UP504]|uniref:Uncharacterized protein n=1 Tax=Hydnum rufescens UP504 TaxID=1448309 RepID=A0A9P6AML3_9AGAM|nr:hypothetical protein BS47DRAFT_1366225 [Hydnum rufescens UP504]
MKCTSFTTCNEVHEVCETHDEVHEIETHGEVHEVGESHNEVHKETHDEIHKEAGETWDELHEEVHETDEEVHKAPKEVHESHDELHEEEIHETCEEVHKTCEEVCETHEEEVHETRKEEVHETRKEEVRETHEEELLESSIVVELEQDGNLYKYKYDTWLEVDFSIRDEHAIVVETDSFESSAPEFPVPLPAPEDEVTRVLFGTEAGSGLVALHEFPAPTGFLDFEYRV